MGRAINTRLRYHAPFPPRDPNTMVDWLQEVWKGLATDFRLPSGTETGQVLGRTLVAALLGGVIGSERMHQGKEAGLRTHALVSLSAAFFVIAPQQAGVTSENLSRVIQGVAAGVGFLGAGTILKREDENRVRGLTTAASLYFATAIGIAAGLGRELVAALGTAAALIVLRLLPTSDDHTPEKPGH